MSNIPDILREVEQKESEYPRVLKNDQDFETEEDLKGLVDFALVLQIAVLLCQAYDCLW